MKIREANHLEHQREPEMGRARQPVTVTVNHLSNCAKQIPRGKFHHQSERGSFPREVVPWRNPPPAPCAMHQCRTTAVMGAVGRKDDEGHRLLAIHHRTRDNDAHPGMHTGRYAGSTLGTSPVTPTSTRWGEAGLGIEGQVNNQWHSLIAAQKQQVCAGRSPPPP